MSTPGENPHLVYSRRGLAPEGDVRCFLERTPSGVRVVLEQGHVTEKGPGEKPTVSTVGWIARVAVRRRC